MRWTPDAIPLCVDRNIQFEIFFGLCFLTGVKGGTLTPMDQNLIRKWAIVHYDYNPLTGIFTNRISGKPVTSKNPKGYVTIEIKQKKFYAHRVAYLIMEGEWPHQTDHRNRIRDDNRWENLLNSDQFLNAQNHGLRKTCRSGVTGVAFTERHGWEASLVRNGLRRRKRGMKTKEEAVAHRADLEAMFERGEWADNQA